VAVVLRSLGVLWIAMEEGERVRWREEEAWGRSQGYDKPSQFGIFLCLCVGGTSTDLTPQPESQRRQENQKKQKRTKFREASR